MSGLFEKAFLRALNEDSFAEMVRDGKAPVSEEEVDELLVPEVEETEDENKSGGISDEMSETSGDTSAEQLSMEEIDREIEKNIENAGKAREEYAKSVNTDKNEFDGVEVDEQLNPVDEMEDGEETIEEKNERRTKEIAEENERVLAREKSVREITENMQEVIVEKPRGFWGWLKSLLMLCLPVIQLILDPVSYTHLTLPTTPYV